MKHCIFKFSTCKWSAFHITLFTNWVNYVSHSVEQNSFWEGSILQIVMRSVAAHWHHLPKTHINVTCVCLLTCSKWLEWLTLIILFVHVSPLKCTWSQLLCFIITYYFLLVLAHLSHHQGEPSTRENIIIHVYI
jgi:hypothetical protein